MIRDVLPRLDRSLRAVPSCMLREESNITSVKVHPLALLDFENLEDQAALHASPRGSGGATGTTRDMGAGVTGTANDRSTRGIMSTTGGQLPNTGAFIGLSTLNDGAIGGGNASFVKAGAGIGEI